MKLVAKDGQPLVWRSLAQVVTIAPFRKPAAPKRCSLHRYHVWRWQTVESDPNQQPLAGMTCQCGGLTWETRESVGGR